MILTEYQVDYSHSTEITMKFLVTDKTKFDPAILMGKELELVPTLNKEGRIRAKDAFTNEAFLSMVEASEKKEAARKAAENNFKREYEKCSAKAAAAAPVLYPYQEEILKTLKREGMRDQIFYSSPRNHGKTAFAQEYYCDWESLRIPTNPCSEIKMINTTPHSELAESRSTLNISGNRLTGTLKLEDDTSSLRVEIPGVDPERVQVKRIDNQLRIRVMPEAADLEDDYGFQKEAPVRELNMFLTAEEQVTDVTVALGVLEISIDRGREVEDFEVNAAD